MIVHLNLNPDGEQLLRAKAAQDGRTLEAFLEEMANREARFGNGSLDHGPSRLADFERGLDELSEGLPPLPTLPPEFSRTDIYGEHG